MSGLRSAGGTAVARARRRSRNSAPGAGAAIGRAVLPAAPALKHPGRRIVDDRGTVGLGVKRLGTERRPAAVATRSSTQGKAESRRAEIRSRGGEDKRGLPRGQRGASRLISASCRGPRRQTLAATWRQFMAAALRWGAHARAQGHPRDERVQTTPRQQPGNALHKHVDERQHYARAVLCWSAWQAGVRVVPTQEASHTAGTTSSPSIAGE